MRLHSASVSTVVSDSTHSDNSSRDSFRLLLRFAAFIYSAFFRARFLVIFERNAPSLAGLAGGIAFHAPSQVSLRHSSQSLLSARMFPATLRQRLPYLDRLSPMARSSLCQYSSIIFHLPFISNIKITVCFMSTKNIFMH